MAPDSYVQTFLISLAMFSGIMAYIQIRSNRSLGEENQQFKKDKRALEAKVEQLETLLDHAQKAKTETPAVSSIAASSDPALKDRIKQLTSEVEKFKSQYNSAMETLDRIKTTVDKPENASNTLTIKIKTYLMAIAALSA